MLKPFQMDVVDTWTPTLSMVLLEIFPEAQEGIQNYLFSFSEIPYWIYLYPYITKNYPFHMLQKETNWL